MTEDVPTAATLPPPAGSTLVYCFADRYVPAPGRLELGQRIPLAGVNVSRTALVNSLLGVAFGSLASRGRLTFREVERKVLFIKSRSVVVSFAPEATIDDESPASLEFDIVKIGSKLKEPTVKDIVRAIYGADVDNPQLRLLMFVSANLSKAGMMGSRVVERHGLIGKVAGDKSELILLEDRILPFAPQADSAWAAYQAWHAQEPLAAKIIAECSAGIASRKKSGDDDDD